MVQESQYAEAAESRSYFESGWTRADEVELHAFADASPKAYGTAAYLRAPQAGGGYVTALVMSKGQVSPLKEASLPRLELLGCVLAARLVTFVRRALRLLECTSIHIWSDSMVALGWIKGTARRWKQFVANCVIQIQSPTSTAVWKLSGRIQPRGS